MMADRNNPFKYYRAERKAYQQLPEELFQYPELEVLNLGENALHKLDERIGIFSKLYSLDLSYNKIEHLPNSFAQLQQLKYLFLNCNQLSIFPEVLFELPNLCFVYLTNNQLTHIPTAIKKWKQLEVLDLANNQLQNLPKSFTSLQQLERLNLTFNNFTHFPVVLCSLTKLRILRLKKNQINQLPSRIGQLQQLEALDLGFNPLENLPASLAQLQQLQELITTSNQFQCFPEVLLELPQLTNLSALDLDFRLGLKTKLLQTLFSILKKIKEPIGVNSSKKAAFALLFDKELEGIGRANIIPLLNIPNKLLQEKLTRFLTQKSSLPSSDSSLYLLGKTSILSEEVLGIIPWATAIDQASHFILGQKIKKRVLQELPATAIFLSENQVQRHYQPVQSLDWLEENKEQIQNLLYSKQGASVLLALQWLERSRQVSFWATDLLLAYILLPFQEKEAIKALQKILLLSLPAFDLKQLPSINFKLYTPEKSELDIAKRIKQCTALSIYWNGLQVAHYLFREHQAGYLYLIEQLPPKQLVTWLQQFLKKDDFCLSPLKELKKLPFLEGDWTVVRRLNLRGCAFRRVPKSDLLKQMPNLEEIDLRDNPIRHLPRKRLSELATYRILISK